MASMDTDELTQVSTDLLSAMNSGAWFHATVACNGWDIELEGCSERTILSPEGDLLAFRLATPEFTYLTIPVLALTGATPTATGWQIRHDNEHGNVRLDVWANDENPVSAIAEPTIDPDSQTELNDQTVLNDASATAEDEPGLDTPNIPTIADLYYGGDNSDADGLFATKADAYRAGYDAANAKSIHKAADQNGDA